MIRRFAVLTGFAMISACAALGASLTPTVLNPLPSSVCVAPPGNVSCGVVNTAIASTTISVTGTPPAGTFSAWSLTAGTTPVPPGISIDPNSGLISGTPTQAGQYTFNVTATYASPTSTVSQLYAVDVYFSSSQQAVAIISPPTSLPAGTVGTAIPTVLFSANYGVPFIDASGNPYYQWSLGANTDGLVINATTGVLSGTPTAPGTYSIVVTATDATGGHAQAPPLSFTANGSGTYTITITTTTMPAGVLNVPYSQVVQQNGAPSPGVTWSVSSGNLPPGLGISSNNDSSGTISGTPTSVGTFNFTVQAAYSGSTPATQALSITINAVTTSLSMPNPAAVTGTVGSTVTMQFTASGGISPYTYSLVSGTPPAGLQLNTSTGAVTGTATAVGSATITVQATDSASHTVQASGTITVNSATPALTLPTPATVSGFVGQTMSTWMQFTATGGTAPYTYSLSAGSLPTGLTLNPTTGAITGQAQQSGSFSFLIQVTDSSSPAQTASSSGTNPATISVSLLTVTGAISLTSSTGTVITPGGAVTAGTQPTVTITLGSAPPEDVSGVLSVGFTRLFDSRTSGEVLFSTGLPAVTFTVPAGSTQATFAGGSLALLVGTAAGFGTVSVTFKDALGNNLSSPTVLPFSFSIAGTTPVIKTFTLSCSGTTYTASVVGYSSTLDMTNAVFNFTPASNTTLAASSATVALGPSFLAWFSSFPSNQYGGSFMLTVPFSFTVSGGSSTNPIVAMTVTLTNSKGASTTSQPANPNPACQ